MQSFILHTNKNHFIIKGHENYGLLRQYIALNYHNLRGEENFLEKNDILTEF